MCWQACWSSYEVVARVDSGLGGYSVRKQNQTHKAGMSGVSSPAGIPVTTAHHECMV
jgi:hypothetical protein